MTRPPHDTVRFEAPASASRCGRSGTGAGGGWLLQGAAGGDGVLIWLRFSDSLNVGEFPVLARGDTTAPRGAIVAIRFMAGDVAHGLTLDSGAVSVIHAGGVLKARARGSGLELARAGRIALEASFESVASGSDTVACQVKP